MPVVKLFANLRKLAGTKEVSISPPSGMLRSTSRGATIGSVLNELVRQNPALDGVLLENGNLRPHIVVTLNGHNTNDMSAQITEQDVIAIFPPIAGG